VTLLLAGDECGKGAYLVNAKEPEKRQKKKKCTILETRTGFWGKTGQAQEKKKRPGEKRREKKDSFYSHIILGVIS